MRARSPRWGHRVSGSATKVVGGTYGVANTPEGDRLAFRLREARVEDLRVVVRASLRDVELCRWSESVSVR